MKETYEDGSTVSYAYDNTGALATVTDSATGITTTYYYDLINRLVKYEEKGTNRSHSVTYIYDEKNNLSSYTEILDGVSTTYAYTYDDDNRVTSMTVGNTTVTYTYDDFGRMSQQVTKHGDTVVLTENATFKDPSDTASSGQITSYNGFDYTYDANGNILSVSDGTNTTTYEYDSLNQLVRENNQKWNKTQTWTYDNAGNIQNRTEYAYTTAADLSTVTPTKTVTYSYDNENWGDLLTGYDGKTFTYDEIGNLTSDGTRAYTWNHGRQLTNVGSWNLTYDANGMRTNRLSNSYSYTYTYNGSQLTKMTVMQKEYLFTYDANGVPLTVTYEGTTFYYSTNLQGDVVAVLDSTGTAVVTYTYDAWGNCTQYYTNSSLFTFIHHQPLRYRGYVYDVETQLYYLQSRYYNPQIGRFISADGLVKTGQGFIGNNMFAYCGNNPVIRVDSSGMLWEWAVAALIGIVAVVLTGCTSFPSDYRFNNSRQYNCYGYAFDMPVNCDPGDLSTGEDENDYMYKNGESKHTVEEIADFVMRDMAAMEKPVRIINSPEEKADDEYVVVLKTSDMLFPGLSVADYHFAILLSDGALADKQGGNASRYNKLGGIAVPWDISEIYREYYNSDPIFFAVKKG